MVNTSYDITRVAIIEVLVPTPKAQQLGSCLDAHCRTYLFPHQLWINSDQTANALEVAAGWIQH
jgi:hypothetical protein